MFPDKRSFGYFDWLRSQHGGVNTFSILYATKTASIVMNFLACFYCNFLFLSHHYIALFSTLGLSYYQQNKVCKTNICDSSTRQTNNWHHSFIPLLSKGGRRGGHMVSALVYGSSSPGSGPGRGHCVVFVSLKVPLSTQVYLRSFIIVHQ